MFGFTKAFLHKAPSGRWCFAGRVPVVLGYRRLDGADLTDDDVRALVQCGAGLLRHRITSRVWDTPEEALAEAARLGFADDVVAPTEEVSCEG